MSDVTHSPFLYNLFICCGGDYKTFVLDISNCVEDKIEKIYKEVKINIENRKIDENNRSIFSKGFHEFVEKMENYISEKSPKYCMFGFYKQIAKVENLLLSSAKEDNTRTSTDMAVLKNFKKRYDYFVDNHAQAINEKRLKDLFVKIKDRKVLSRIQEDIFEFLLTEYFPNYGDERGGLLERINSKSWEEVAFGDVRHQKMANVFLQKNGRSP